MGARRRIFVLVVLVAIAAACVGCGSDGEPTAEPSGTEMPAAGQAAPATGPEGGDSDGRPVLLLGRSVMGGWFTHWGWDGSPESMPLARDGYALTYGEVSGPPDIASSAVRYMEQAPEGGIVVFKFCFVDFLGDEDADARLAQQEGWVETVAAKARERGQHLIVGNALPQVASATTPQLVAEHRAFNTWLDGFAADSGGAVSVLDLHATLAGSDGTLEAEYAASPDDSHLNDRGYAELDRVLFDLLGEVSD